MGCKGHLRLMLGRHLVHCHFMPLFQSGFSWSVGPWGNRRKKWRTRALSSGPCLAPLHLKNNCMILDCVRDPGVVKMYGVTLQAMCIHNASNGHQNPVCWDATWKGDEYDSDNICRRLRCNESITSTIWALCVCCSCLFMGSLLAKATSFMSSHGHWLKSSLSSDNTEFFTRQTEVTYVMYIHSKTISFHVVFTYFHHPTLKCYGEFKY